MGLVRKIVQALTPRGRTRKGRTDGAWNSNDERRRAAAELHRTRAKAQDQPPSFFGW
jgi:hypothetical protein